MHIPDGFLAAAVWAPLHAAAAPTVGYFARKAQRGMDEGRAPLLGVMGAFVFAAQMINFPVGVGTSGHLVGSALLAFTLGPAAAVVVMTAILVVQSLVFQDGGLLALGANVCNMAIAGVLAGYLPYRYWGDCCRRGAVFLGGVLSVMTAACLAVAELRLSGVPMANTVLGVSMALFVVSAAVEGAITMAVVSTLERMNPGWVRAGAGVANHLKGGLAVAAIVMASVGALWASALPDGLESLSVGLGISDRAANWFHTPLSGYEMQMPGAAWMRKVAAGMVGLALIYAVCLMLMRLLTRRRSV